MDNCLRLNFQEDPRTLDPQACSDRISSAIIFLLFKGLTRLEADRTIRCDLADSFQISNDFRTYTFFLGEHCWSNGRPITAHDFVFSWQRALHPDFSCSFINFFYPIKNAKKVKKGLLPPQALGISAKSEKIFVVELEDSCPYFLELTSFCTLFPVPSFVKEESDFPVCSGPFRLESWDRGQEIILRKNLFSKNPSNVRLDTICIRIIPSEKEAFSLFEKGQLDWIGDPVSPLSLNYLPALLEAKKVKPVAGIVSCWFNTLKTPFHELSVRKAFFQAIEQEVMTKKLMLPNISPSLPGILGSKPYKKSPCEIEKAFRTLSAKHFKLTLAYEMTEEHSRLAAVLKKNWEEAFPVTVLLTPLPFKEFFEILPRHEFHMVLFCAISTYTDPMNFLERLEFRDSPKNFAKWKYAPYQKVLCQYRKTLNPEKRKELAGRAEEILLDQLPIAPLYSYHYSYLQKPYVKNLTISPIGVVQFDRVFLEGKEAFNETHFSTSLLSCR